MQSSNVFKLDEHYTYADFLTWDEHDLDKHDLIELIDGEPFMMSPPSIKHQDISGELFNQIKNFLKGKPCKVFSAPVGVRLFPKADLSDDTIVLPDIIIVCDRAKLDKQSCNGAPDLVIEILSPSTARHDQTVKFHLYQEAGVREYWTVDPERRLVHAYALNNGNYITTVYDETKEIPVSALPGCLINLKEVFAE